MKLQIGLLADVVKERFTYIDVVKSDNNESAGYCEDIPLDTESGVVCKEEEEDTNTKGDDSTLDDDIDWDDI